MKKTIMVNLSVDSEELVGTILDALTEDEIFEFIVSLDKEAQSWDLTKRLHSYFTDELKKL
jgi:hypothetical protein